MTDTYEAVLNHLLFHKALLPDDDGGERIDRYLAMVREIESGQHVAVRDPTEKSIAAAFELVLEAQLDPWAIDLAQFTRMYVDKVHQDGMVNFVTAGKLVFMAWSILKMQSDRLLEAATPPAAIEPDSEDLDFYREPEDVDYNQAVLLHDQVPLHEAIRREGRRAVSLLELVAAFDEARQEAEAQIRINALREEARRRLPADVREKVHGEDITEDIGLTWARILECNGRAVPLRSLTTGDAWDVATVFMAVLFLTKMGKIKVWQREFPSGDIFVRRIATERAIAPGEVATLATAATPRSSIEGPEGAAS